MKNLLIENKILRKELQRNYDFENFIGKSNAIKRIYEMINTVAETDSTVLIIRQKRYRKRISCPRTSL